MRRPTSATCAHSQRERVTERGECPRHREDPHPRERAYHHPPPRTGLSPHWSREDFSRYTSWILAPALQVIRPSYYRQAILSQRIPILPQQQQDILPLLLLLYSYAATVGVVDQLFLCFKSTEKLGIGFKNQAAHWDDINIRF